MDRVFLLIVVAALAALIAALLLLATEYIPRAHAGFGNAFGLLALMLRVNFCVARAG